jgi:RimJ/RimL family protein N-acetyltransferase
MTGLVHLRALVEGDLVQLHRWYQDPALWDHLVGEFVPREETEAVGYMRSWLTPSLSEVRLAILDAADGGLAGLVALSPIDRSNGEAEFHIFLGEARSRGRGLGRAATAAALDHAFETLGLWRVWLRVLQTNEAALRTYAALGFEPDAIVAATVRKQGAEAAVITMRVSDAVYRARQAAYVRRSATR